MGDLGSPDYTYSPWITRPEERRVVISKKPKKKGENKWNIDWSDLSLAMLAALIVGLIIMIIIK